VLAAGAEDAGGAPTRQDLQQPLKPVALAELDEDEETQDPGRIAQLFTSPIGGRGPVARLLQRLLGMGREEGTGPAGAELPTGSARATNRIGPNAVRALLPVTLEAMTERPEPGVAVYPEWDTNRRRYRAHWCTVIEVETPDEGRRPLARAPNDPVLRRRLARLGLGLEAVRRQPEGDELDLDALVDLQVALAADRAGVAASSAREPHHLIERQRRRRDLAVLVLLDVSGSASEKGADGDSVHEHQRAVAASLVDALDALGDRVAAYGFHSRGRAAVRLVRVKSFSDPFDSRARERLGALEPGAFTRLGAAIRHATHLLETDAGTARRLLVVLSDGFAYDYGYEGDYGEADARRALAEARARSVGSLCLSIGATVDAAALRRVFGTSAHVGAPTFDAVRDQMGMLFRRALTIPLSAAAPGGKPARLRP
jgi:nitric oxide reductase activation protein